LITLQVIPSVYLLF